jgi:polysaccharide deacetylase family protein (PEP-CTERM system associated)
MAGTGAGGYLPWSPEIPMRNALTIDVEDYYHVAAFESVVSVADWDRYESRVEHNTEKILALLDDASVHATFFVLGWVAERYPQLVRRIARAQHEVACHGYAHRRVYTMTPHAFRQDVRTAKQLIEDAAGVPVIGYRAPSYSITAQSLWALAILAEEGFKYDSSIFPIRHDLYGIPHHPRFFHLVQDHVRPPLAEFPLSTVTLAGVNVPVAGGGYLRLLPYSVTRWAIRHLNQKEQQPAIVYFHPWELDPDQPRIQAGWRSRFRHYTHLQYMETKVRQLLSDFAFVSLCETYAIHVSNHVA